MTIQIYKFAFFSLYQRKHNNITQAYREKFLLLNIGYVEHIKINKKNKIARTWCISNQQSRSLLYRQKKCNYTKNLHAYIVK
jgi:hypothetical protein